MRTLVRRLAWVGVALCLVALAFGVTMRLLGPEPPGVTEGNVRRLRPGMSRADVERILGGPDVRNLLTGPRRGHYIATSIWEGRDGIVTVMFRGNDQTEQVLVFRFSNGPRVSPLDRLRSLLGW